MSDSVQPRRWQPTRLPRPWDSLGKNTGMGGWSSKRCPGIGFLSRGDREIGVLRNVEPPTRPRLECRRETGLILRCDRKVGNPFQTKQGNRPSCPDQEGRKGSCILPSPPWPDQPQVLWAELVRSREQVERRASIQPQPGCIRS